METPPSDVFLFFGCKLSANPVCGWYLMTTEKGADPLAENVLGLLAVPYESVENGGLLVVATENVGKCYDIYSLRHKNMSN